MTNAEKYLKDGVDLADLLERLDEDLNWFRYEEAIKGASLDFIKFFNAEERKPTLTEDERVILSNIKEFNYIGREEDNDLYVRFRYSEAYTEKHYIDMFRHLFKFIKEGEEYSIEELLK